VKWRTHRPKGVRFGRFNVFFIFSCSCAALSSCLCTKSRGAHTQLCPRAVMHSSCCSFQLLQRACFMLLLLLHLATAAAAAAAVAPPASSIDELASCCCSCCYCTVLLLLLLLLYLFLLQLSAATAMLVQPNCNFNISILPGLMFLKMGCAVRFTARTALRQSCTPSPNAIPTCLCPARSARARQRLLTHESCF
jgi:hypothetical protein